MTQRSPWHQPSVPGQYPKPPRNPLTVLRTVVRVVGIVVGVFFFIMAITVLRAEKVWLPAVVLFATAWALLYFSAVSPWLKRRKIAAAPSKPGSRLRSALRKTTIGVVVPFLVVIATGIADMAVHPEEYEAIRNDSSSPATPSASATPRPTTATEPTAPQPDPVTFIESMVRAHGVTKNDKGGQSNVRFVAGTEDPEQIEDLQRQCVQYYLEITEAAYCYGYANDADYAVTTVEWTPEFDEGIYGQGRPCWITYGGQPIAGEPGTRTMKSALEYQSQGCPGKVSFADDPQPVPAPTTDTPLAPVPVHDACALLDADALRSGGFSNRTEQAPNAPESTAHGDVLATYACGNSDASVIVEIDLHTSPDSARDAADYNTSDDQRFLIDSGARVPFDATRGGAKIINTELGISRVSWSNGPYAVLLEVMSDPVVPGLPVAHPYENIDTMITTIVDHADTRITSSNW